MRFEERIWEREAYHAVLSDEREEGLGSLLDGLVEGFGRGVSVFTEDLVLSKEHSLCMTSLAPLPLQQ
jgi:hypothetical protein